MTKKIILILLTLVLSDFAYSETLNIVGTGSGASVLRALAEDFSSVHKNIKVIVPVSIGSGGGIKAVAEDREVMGRIARDLKSREKAFGINVLTFAKIPVVVFVNRSVTLRNITSSQFCGIYAGKIRLWDELKGGSGKIRVIKRENNDSSDTVLRHFLDCFRDLEITRRSKTTYSDPATIEECSSQKNAIAFGAWPNVKNLTKVTALKFDGKDPQSHDYKCVGIISLIYKDKNFDGALKKFVTFVKTKRASMVIRKAGGTPVF